MEVTLSPHDPQANAQQLGGELGATLFVAGIRIWLPQAATSNDIEAAIRGLQCFAAVRREDEPTVAHSDQCPVR